MCADSCVYDSYHKRCVRQILSGNRYGLIISEKQGKTQIDTDFTNSGGDAEFVVKHKYPTGNRKPITSAGYQMPALPPDSNPNISSTTRSRRFKSWTLVRKTAVLFVNSRNFRTWWFHCTVSRLQAFNYIIPLLSFAFVYVYWGKTLLQYFCIENWIFRFFAINYNLASLVSVDADKFRWCASEL